ncbi:MAG: hypothetical protein IPJ71_00730 [Bdellovibrionales bacterium]|nr:hypothetical protein [Bdellovibrionales bacterium]
MKNSEQRLKTKEYWQTKIREAESFSGPETEFCRQEGLNITTFKKRAAHSLPDAQWVAELIFYLQGGTR